MKDHDETDLPLQMWSRFNEKNWEAAQKLLSEDFEAYWPQSNERFVGPHNFIEVNRIYPGTHKIEVLDSHQSYDRWEHSHKVTTEVYIESKMPDGKEMKLFTISFFEIVDGKITFLKEYFAETYSAPDWRKHLVVNLEK